MTKNTTVNTSGFIMLPRELLSAKFTTLSLHARVLYSLLLDRNELSEKNGMNDDCGKIVVFFPVEEVCQRLGCCRDTVTKLFRELEKFGMIKRKIQGLGRTALIYVKALSEYEAETEQSKIDDNKNVEQQDFAQRQNRITDADKSALQTPIFQDSGCRKNRNQEADKTVAIYTERNYTEKNYQENIYPQSISYDDAIDEIAHQIEYDVLSERGYGGMLVPVETIRSRFSRLSAEHIEQVIRSLECNAVNVRIMRAYLLTAIYNSVDALEILSLEGCADAFKKQRNSGNYYGENKKPTHSYADRFVCELS